MNRKYVFLWLSIIAIAGVLTVVFYSSPGNDSLAGKFSSVPFVTIDQSVQATCDPLNVGKLQGHVWAGTSESETDCKKGLKTLSASLNGACGWLADIAIGDWEKGNCIDPPPSDATTCDRGLKVGSCTAGCTKVENPITIGELTLPFFTRTHWELRINFDFQQSCRLWGGGD